MTDSRQSDSRKESTTTVKTDYQGLQNILAANVASDDDFISLLANASALFNQYLSDINWVGFYLVKNDRLVLGPFQGKVACNRITIGMGVCGTAVSEKAIQRVADVHQFPGHIACDSASNSEIVLPIFIDNEVVAVLDIDSPKFSRFLVEDEKELAKCVEILSPAFAKFYSRYLKA